MSNVSMLDIMFKIWVNGYMRAFNEQARVKTAIRFQNLSPAKQNNLRAKFDAACKKANIKL